MSKTEVPASVRARILQLCATGCPGGVTFDSTGRGTDADSAGKTSYRAIAAVVEAEGYTTTYVTVGAVIKEARARGWTPDAAPKEPGPVQVQGTGRAQGGGRLVHGTGTGAGTPPGEPEEPPGDNDGDSVELPPLPEDATIAARVLYQRIKDSDRRMREVPNDADFASKYSALARVNLQQVRQLAALIPPSKPDPKHDPTNLAARELIRERCIDKVNGVLERARRAGFRVPDEL